MATTAAYRATPEGREKANAAAAAYRATPAGRKKHNAATATYKATPEGREKHNAASREWRKANRGKANAWHMAYKAAKLQQTPTWTQHAQIEALYAEAARLTKETSIPHHVDHGIPLRGRCASGLHVLENLRIRPGPENCSKNNKRDLQWERSLGYHVD